LQIEDLLLHRVGGDEAVGYDGLAAADAAGAVDRLRLGGVSPWVEQKM
jgi:hypothetical protein